MARARDHPKKASSSSKNESNNNESLSTRKLETELLSLSDKCAIRITRFIRFAGKINQHVLNQHAAKITRFIRFAGKMNGESWYGREYDVRESLAKAKDSQVREFYKAVEKNASNILRACFPSEGCDMNERIREIFGQSTHSEINKLRKEYEEKVTAPIQESIKTFSFHQTTNCLNIEIFMRKCEERRLIGRISNLVDKSCKTRKLIKDLETKTKAVEAEASLIMEEKDKRIIELESIIKEYKENLSNRNKHIMELEEKLGGGAENMPVDNGGLPSINQHNPTPQHQHASTINNNYYYNVKVNPYDTYAAYTPAFATPFQSDIQGIQYGIQNGQYGQDGQLHNVKIQGVRKRKCRECNNYGCRGSNNRDKCDNKKA